MAFMSSLGLVYAAFAVMSAGAVQHTAHAIPATNAERLQRGLGPGKPRSLFDPMHAEMHDMKPRASPSPSDNLNSFQVKGTGLCKCEYTVTPKSDYVGHNVIQDREIVASRMECINLCDSDVNCLAGDFNAGSGQCITLAAKSAEFDYRIQLDESWDRFLYNSQTCDNSECYT